MTDAALYHEELLELEQQVERIIEDVDASQQSATGSRSSGNVNSTTARAAAFSKAQDALRRLNRLLQQLRVEVRLLDGEEGDAYDTFANEHATKISLLRERVQQSKEKAAQQTAQFLATTPDAMSSAEHAQYNAVKGGAGVVWSPRDGEDGAGREGDQGPVLTNRLEARQAATRINEVQQGTLQSLGNTERLLNDTEKLGHEAATTLQTQTEQIVRTNAELDEMHSELGRASTELKSFMRRLARDRLILFFLIAIVVCIIIIVILAVLKHKYH